VEFTEKKNRRKLSYRGEVVDVVGIAAVFVDEKEGVVAKFVSECSKDFELPGLVEIEQAIGTDVDVSSAEV
jgi:hypothetical protein